MPTLYRVENPNSMQGLWYDGHGRYNGFIRQFGDAKCHDVPMGFDPKFKDGGDWFSACDNLKDMANWFSPDDLTRLHGIGYRLYSMEVDRYRTINGHAAFLRSGIIHTSPASLAMLTDEWNTP